MLMTMAISMVGAMLALGVQVAAGISHDFYQAVAVTPLVVVPHHNLGHVAVYHFGKQQVYNAGVAVADVIATY